MYAVLYLSIDGEIFEEYVATDDFLISGSSSFDEYEIDTGVHFTLVSPGNLLSSPLICIGVLPCSRVVFTNIFPEDAILRQAKTVFNGSPAQLDVVLLRTGKVNQGGSVALRRNDSQIHFEL